MIQKIARWVKTIAHKIITRIKFEYRCYAADLWWQPCFSMYPPSFYMRHTPEEASAIIQKDVAKLEQLLSEFEKQLTQTEKY